MQGNPDNPSSYSQCDVEFAGDYRIHTSCPCARGTEYGSINIDQGGVSCPKKEGEDVNRRHRAGVVASIIMLVMLFVAFMTTNPQGSLAVAEDSATPLEVVTTEAPVAEAVQECDPSGQCPPPQLPECARANKWTTASPKGWSKTYALAGEVTISVDTFDAYPERVDANQAFEWVRIRHLRGTTVLAQADTEDLADNVVEAHAPKLTKTFQVVAGDLVEVIHSSLVASATDPGSLCVIIAERFKEFVPTPKPSASATQPTCAVPTGSVTISNGADATGNATFDINGTSHVLTPGESVTISYPIGMAVSVKSAGMQEFVATFVAPTDCGQSGPIPVPTPQDAIPTAPVFADPCGSADDAFTIIATQGVTYRVNSVVYVPGRYQGAGIVTITAVADSGYRLVGTTSWTFGWTSARCEHPTF